MNPADAAFDALAERLEDLASVTAQLTHDAFTASDVPGVSGAIGGHVRHCLDHVLALERALDTGVVDYDARRRHTAIERDRELAILSLTAAARRLRRPRDLSVLGRPMVVRTLITPGGPVLECRSSVAREFAFVLSHTIHHSAHVALLAHRAGTSSLPDRFGLAPATPALTGAA